jgi:putative glutamine amidotransferase
MAKPWIGIPTRYHDKTETIGQIRHYLEAVLWAGGLPLLIPTVDSPSIVREYFERVDAVLLPGSPTDIDPARYGEEPDAKMGKRSPERDATDFVLLEYGDKARLPLLGICFGVQSLNVFRGGSLVQDIPSLVAQPLFHDDENDDPLKPARHLVRLEKDSLLARFAGSGEADVNSFHHQSVGRVGKDLRVTAVASDGVIEGIEDTSGRFVVGVQWHPERGWKDDAFSRTLFTAFIEAARKSQSHRHSV